MNNINPSSPHADPGYSRQELRSLLHQLLNMGETLLLSGAEINRVEDTLSRMGKAYGAAKMNVFVITSILMVTMGFPGDQEVTQTRRISRSAAAETNFNRLERLNALSRECAACPLPIHELRRRINDIRYGDPEVPRFVAGSVIAAAGFCVFFGGTPADAAAAGIFALLICFLQRRFYRFCPNIFIFDLLCSILVGSLIGALAIPLDWLHADKVMIGDIMLLIPGIALTNAVRDMLVGDTLSGIMRLIESLFWSGAIAIGFMVAMLITRVPVPLEIAAAPRVQLVMALAGALGFSLMFRLRRKLIPGAVLGGFLTWGVFLLARPHFTYMGIFIPGLIATAVGSLYAELLARFQKAPAILFLIPTLIPMMPGGPLYYMMSFAVAGMRSMVNAYTNLTVEYALAIATGMSLIWSVFFMIEQIRLYSRQSIG
ncbi:threonine/serine ThrE exporter family protein [Lachnoclostridium sp. Marseille-P6806]|uniref:threonine/serine ThrE exporter family protein n=1 Tax=Lachnoclostridium sp. Marseille-P6806 TaxID=2364793 RepID=UPI0013EF3946|nr:threonine/serine exporter family protein [Lachnoclostridium sp. Marseille-P6806]